MRAALFMVGAAMLLAVAGCATTKERQAHIDRAEQVHQNAPQWFKDGWRTYIEHAERGGFAVLAMDRNALGWGYVWCQGPQCYLNTLPDSRSFVDVEYKHGALELCRENVRAFHPAAKPECAIFAVKNEIVWQGAMPWSVAGTREDAPVVAEPAPGRTSAYQRTFTLSWVGSTELFTGTLDIVEGKRSGSIAAVLEGRDCDGRFWFNSGLSGQWKIDCGDGWLTATGDFTANGGPKGGGRGTGTDNLGRLVEFVVDPAS